MSTGSKKKISLNGNYSNSLPLFGNESCSREIETSSSMKSSTGTYHGQHNYHTHPDQTKSLQELQHEVGALLEFRDLVIETFPDLKQKISTTNSTINSGASSSSIMLRREWEPGIRVRRKLNNVQRDSSGPAGLLIRSRSNSQSSRKENKSGGENHGSVVIQDSGFSTETTSSKENNSALPGDSENELLNLLDIIHKKSYELQEDVSKVVAHETSSTSSSSASSKRTSSFQKALNFVDARDVQSLRVERDLLLQKVSKLEAKLTLHAIKDPADDPAGQNEKTKADVFYEDGSKYFKDSQVPDIYYENNNLVEHFRMSESKFKTTNTSDESSTQDYEDPNVDTHSNNHRRSLKPADPFRPNIPDSEHSKIFFKHFINEIKNLGKLDGILSSPNSKLSRVRSVDSSKITAILLENNVIELQRHLITTIIQNQALHQKLEFSAKSRNFLMRKLNKLKEEKDDLKFKVEEKNIELEGTRAQLRVVEQKHLAKCDEEYAAMLLNDEKQLSSYSFRDSSEDPLNTNIGHASMKTMQHLLFDEVHNNSSSTESAQDQQEFGMSSKKLELGRQSRRPSKIPLPGARVNSASSKMSMDRSLVKPRNSSLSNKTLNKSTGSLYYGSATFKSTESVSTPKKFSFNHSDVNDLSIDSKFRSSSIPIANKSPKSIKEVSTSSSPSKAGLSASPLSKSSDSASDKLRTNNYSNGRQQYSKKKMGNSESSEDLPSEKPITNAPHQTSTKFNTKRLNKRSGSYNYSLANNTGKKDDESNGSNLNLKNTINYEPSNNETNRVKNIKSSIWNWLKI